MEAFISLMYAGLSFYHALNNEAVVALCYVAIAVTYLTASHFRRSDVRPVPPEPSSPEESKVEGPIE